MAIRTVKRPQDALYRALHVVWVGMLLLTVYLAGMIGSERCAVIIDRLLFYPWPGL